jgi:hypothetical protein
MTRQFREGQDVEVFSNSGDGKFVPVWHWRKAKIVPRVASKTPGFYVVQFPDGTCDVFIAELIRLSKHQVEQELIKNGERFLDAMGDEVKL